MHGARLPWRFTGGDGGDRVCPDHQADGDAPVISRASGFAITYDMPGDKDDREAT